MNDDRGTQGTVPVAAPLIDEVAMTQMTSGVHSDRVRLARWAGLAGYGALLLGLTLSTLMWPSRGREPSVVIWLLLVVPLLIFLPGLIRGAIRTYAWLCFVTLLYFAIAVPNAFLADGRALALLELGGSVVLFVSAMLYVRWASQLAATAAAEPTAPNKQA